jgi:8-oxo-dGTP pyrophosphatase MutT (NUDIX family)
MTISRDFTVAVFVVHHDHVLLHPHRKLGIWLPPGGHIESNELPDEAALREVEEEAGIAVELVGGYGVEVDEPGAPRQLVRPQGIQLEDISPGHQHIDLVYYARPAHAAPDQLPAPIDEMRWLREEELDAIELTNEVRTWARQALRAFRR